MNLAHAFGFPNILLLLAALFCWTVSAWVFYNSWKMYKLEKVFTENKKR
jgi:hypothetical protein